MFPFPVWVQSPRRAPCPAHSPRLPAACPVVSLDLQGVWLLWALEPSCPEPRGGELCSPSGVEAGLPPSVACTGAGPPVLPPEICLFQENKKLEEMMPPGTLATRVQAWAVQ